MHKFENAQLVANVVNILTYYDALDLLICNGYFRNDELFDPDHPNIMVGLKCSDTFDYAIADAEDVTEENFEDFANTMKAVYECSDFICCIYGVTIWIAKNRKRTPIPPVLQEIKKTIAEECPNKLDTLMKLMGIEE